MLVVAEPPEEFRRAGASASSSRPPSRRATRAPARPGRLPRRALRHVPPDPRHAGRRHGRRPTSRISPAATIAAGTLPMTPRQPRRLDRRSAGIKPGAHMPLDQARAGRAAAARRLPGGAEVSAALSASARPDERDLAATERDTALDDAELRAARSPRPGAPAPASSAGSRPSTTRSSAGATSSPRSSSSSSAASSAVADAPAARAARKAG